MRALLTLTISSLFLCPAASYADSCEDIAADTIAEMRAGTAGNWSDEIQSLVRAAAGSACIKARSGRYTMPQQGSMEPLAEGGDDKYVDSASAAAAAPAASEASSPAAAEQASDQEDDGSWSVGGLTFRSMSGSPTQKPYERARQNKKAEQQ